MKGVWTTEMDSELNQSRRLFFRKEDGKEIETEEIFALWEFDIFE